MTVEQAVNDEVAILIGRLLIEKITLEATAKSHLNKIKELENIIAANSQISALHSSEDVVINGSGKAIRSLRQKAE